VIVRPECTAGCAMVRCERSSWRRFKARSIALPHTAAILTHKSQIWLERLGKFRLQHEGTQATGSRTHPTRGTGCCARWMDARGTEDWLAAQDCRLTDCGDCDCLLIGSRASRAFVSCCLCPVPGGVVPRNCFQIS
jgi:hypothetical protein